VQSRIDVHCTPITTAQREKQRLRLTNRGRPERPRSALRGASQRSPPAAISPARARAACARKFLRRVESPVPQALSRCELMRVACARTAARRSASTSRWSAGAAAGRFFAPKNFFAPSRRCTAPAGKFRSWAPNRGADSPRTLRIAVARASALARHRDRDRPAQSLGTPPCPRQSPLRCRACA
jgi:hypothetical protein